MAEVAEATSVELLVRGLLKKATELSREEYLVLQLNMGKTMEKLLGDLESLQNGLSYVGKQEPNGQDSLLIQFWLQEVKDFAHDAQDLADEILTTAAVRRSHAAVVAHPTFVTAAMDRAWEKKRLNDEMQPMMQRLSDLLNKKNTMIRSTTEMLRSADQTKPGTRYHVKRPESGCMQPYGFKMIGREKEHNQIAEKMLRSSLPPAAAAASSSQHHHTRNVSTLGVVGMAGIGKTTLMQSVYNDERVRQHFGHRKWVHVGDRFDARSLINALLEDGAQPYANVHTSLTRHLEQLQEKLKTKVQGQRFLLVLDDVWNEDSNRWRELWIPLSHGKKGSHVVVTTRNQDVVATVQGVCVPLQELSNESCCRIIENHAVDNQGDALHPLRRQALEKICMQVAGKIMGNPLAATTVGKMLAVADDEGEWESIVAKEAWIVAKDLVSSLKWSYRNLPPEVKPCFQYCSLFPKGHRFDGKDLILKWKALDLLEPVGGLSLEDVGKKHLDVLVHRSLMRKAGDERHHYYVHNLIHDLAKMVSSSECSAVDEICEWSRLGKIRHVSVHHGRRKDKFCKVERLQTYLHQRVRTVLHFRGTDGGCTLRCVPENLCRSLRYLRVLDLRDSGITTLPRSVGRLMLLRYLNLSNCRLHMLPESVCELHNLQTLKLSGNLELNVLPSSTSRLVNLRFLEVPAILSGVERLKNLQELPEFTVLRLENEISSNIVQLGDVNQLRGRLCIKNLQVLQSEEDATSARLTEKRQLDVLVLKWGWEGNIGRKRTVEVRKRRSNTNLMMPFMKRRRHMVLDTSNHGHDDEAAILEFLEPYHHLRRLEIHGYSGAALPDWIASLTHEQLTIWLEGCSGLTSIHLPKNLTKLRLVDCAKLQKISFSDRDVKLNRLVVQKCPMFDAVEWVEELTTLEELTVDDWGLLEKIMTEPTSYRSLKKLCIKELVTASDRQQQHDHGMEEIMKALGRSLEHLRFESCKDMRSLPQEICHLTSLSKLDVDDCPGVTSVPLPSTSLEQPSKHGFPKLSKATWSEVTEEIEEEQRGDKGSSSSGSVECFSWQRLWRCGLEVLRPLNENEWKLVAEWMAWWNRHFSLIPFMRFCFVLFVSAYNCLRLINTEWWGTMVVALFTCLLIIIVRQMLLRSP